MEEIDISEYAHSPAHLAVLRRDYSALRKIIEGLPNPLKLREVNTEAESIAAELQADQFSAVIDRQDVPGRETPLFLAVRLKDAQSVEILMTSGADCSLQNENGWYAYEEAVCTGEDKIAVIISRYFRPYVWAVWRRLCPRIIASLARTRDFYVEISFHFESSIIPFIDKIAPSDTYRIWKRGSNIRADTTLAGYDGFHPRRSDETYLFLGDGCSPENGSLSLPPGSMILLSHDDKDIRNALQRAGALRPETEIASLVTKRMQSGTYSPRLDITQAEVVPRLNWMGQGRTEMVGNWNAKIYEMLNVVASLKSRRAPGAKKGEEHCDLVGILTAEERKQLDSALCMDDLKDPFDDEDNVYKECHEDKSAGTLDSGETDGTVKDKKSWFSGRKNRTKNPDDALADLTKKLLKLSPSPETQKEDTGNTKKGEDKNSKRKKNKGTSTKSKLVSKYKIGLRPLLWLTPDFPVKTEELLPLLDILAIKDKFARRLRDVLTTKLPQGTLPVKVVIPIVATVRIIATFTKFEELPSMDEFSTPPSSPTSFKDAKSDGSDSWISRTQKDAGRSSENSESRRHSVNADPFSIPSDYTWDWVDSEESKPRTKNKKDKTKKNPRQSGDEK